MLAFIPEVTPCALAPCQVYNLLSRAQRPSFRDSQSGEKGLQSRALSDSLASDGDDPVALFANMSQIYSLFLPVTFIS